MSPTKPLLLAALVAGLTGCISAQHAKYALIAETSAVTACDLGQTLWMAHDGRWDRDLTEMNPLLGDRPSDGRIIAMNLSAVLLNAAIGLTLPKSWGITWLGATATVETANVTTNPDGGHNRPFCGVGG